MSAPLTPEVLGAIRDAVRTVLDRTPAAEAAPRVRDALETQMVRSAELAAGMAAEELAASGRPLASAQADGGYDPKAARNAAAVFKATREAIDFPNYVSTLITGVFEAITKSSITQLERLVDLLENVAASGASFAEANLGDVDVKRWATSRFGFVTPDEDGALTLREGADLAEKQAVLKDALEATGDEVSSIDEGDLDGTLLPLCRRKMARDKQAILATMIKMGMQRVVVDEGQLHASMDMRVDTSSISEQMAQDRSAFGVEAEVKGSFGVGPWGASARVGTSYSKVHAEQEYSKEEMAVRAGLRSSVDLAFRTEQVPLDRLADKGARVKLDLKARVPEDVGVGSTLSTNSQLKSADMAGPNLQSRVPDVSPPGEERAAGTTNAAPEGAPP